MASGLGSPEQPLVLPKSGNEANEREIHLLLLPPQ